MWRFGMTASSNRLARAQAAENAAERSDRPRGAEGVPVEPSSDSRNRALRAAGD